MYGDAALLKLTSGSTGFPKAILTHEAHLVADGERIIEAMGISAADTQLAVIPLSHAYGFGNLILPLLLQGTAILLRDSFVPSQVLLDARGAQCRVFAGVPYMFSFLAANAPADDWPACLQLMISAGARLDAHTSQAFYERFGIKIHSFYGASETGGIAYDASDALMPEGHVGVAMPGVTISVRPTAIYAGAAGHLYCLDPASGAIRWHNSLDGLGTGLVAFGDTTAGAAADAAAQAAAAAATASAAST